MKRSKTLIVILILAVIAAIQFWPVERTNPPVTSDVEAPPETRAVLRTACYDCHSNETRWPWYSRIAPVSWLVVHDVHHAREHVNFSEWDSIPDGDRATVARRIWKEIEDGEMPLLMYRIMHPEARLSEDQKTVIKNWAK